MIGLVIAVIRGAYPEESIVTALNREHVDLPRAPGTGLLLESVSQCGGSVRGPVVAMVLTECSTHCPDCMFSACIPLSISLLQTFQSDWSLLDTLYLFSM